FGLGEMDQIDSIRIDWPNGHVDHLGALTVDSLHHIVEGIEDPPNGTKDLIDQLAVKVSPNPFAEGFRVNFEKPISSEVQLKLTTADGVKVIEKVLETGSSQTNVEVPANLPNGLYFLQIVLNDLSVVKKLVKF
ncbi:MAG: T9SS type A sorting domain-containing protein, partial [Saprospiraceae bacterium]